MRAPDGAETTAGSWADREVASMRRRAAASPSTSPGAEYRRRDNPPQEGQGAVAVTDAMGIVIVETPCSAQMNSYVAMKRS